MFRMMIVEDEPRILRYLKEKITSLSPDFKVVGAYNNGEDALIELHWTQPHVLITDIRMPVMNGLELISRVKEKLPDIQCAIISGYDDYPYLREAIKLGITDYLLKPASDEEVSDLLAKLKEKLLLNQALLEREVARQITEAASEPDASARKWKEIAQELFYHGNYLLLYAWTPIGDMEEDLQSHCLSLLREGEKVTPLPSAAGSEQILLVGIHSWSAERRHEWLSAIEEKLQTESGITVLLALSDKGFLPVPALLSECKKQAVLRSRFLAACFWMADSCSAEDIHPLTEPVQPLLLGMSQFVNKQQKQSFGKELELLFAGGSGLQHPVTRKGWDKLLLYMSLTLHSLTKDAFSSTFEAKQAMENELSEEVWKAKSIADLHHQVKEIWGAYFFKTEPEQAAQRNWAEDAKKWIHSHYHENISLTSVAETFQLHPAYLNRVFKRSFQISIPDYLVKLRMEEACRFIKEHPFVLIKEIAEHVGYADPFYFSKVFKQHTGYSPSDYKSRGE